MARSKAAEANRLYWESDVSVAEIAQRLELSRRALYETVEPLAAGRECEQCGGPLTYENRSARNTDHATCRTCDGEGTATAPSSAQPVDIGDEHPAVRLAGAALAGVALGALATLVLVKRR